MNKLILRNLVISLFVLLTCSMQRALASHSMGADLTYTCLGGNTYQLRLSFYRDCIGIAAPTNAFINISSVSCGQTLGITAYPIPGTGQEVTPICPSALSTCNGGSFTGIQEWVYEGIVTLPMQCTDWVFSFNLCCRNAAITTITTPGSSTFYIYATLNNVITPCNNSPTFSNKPVPFVCLGQEFCFNHGAYDADGDSLVYSLITPYQTATTNVNYIGPYNATQPLNSVPAMQFNTATGDICMTPQQLQVTVMAVLVSEYRNGVLIGTVERDIQITVITCTNNLPTLTGINGTNNFSATICANEPFCFNVFSDDVDAGQNVFVDYDQSIPGATFSATSVQHPVGTFCWTPTTANISATPYCFTISVHDDACPYMGYQIYSYCLTVVGVVANAGPDQYIACNDIATLYASGSGGTPPYTYLWSNGSTASGITVGVGTYIVTVSDGTCSDQDTVNVIAAFIPVAAFTPTTGCVNTPIQFIDQSTTPGGVITSWNWNFGDGQTSTVQNPIHIYTVAGTYNVQLIIQNNFGCIDTVIVPVIINPIPTAGFTFPNGCAGTTVQFTNTTTPAGTYNWSWNFGNGQTSTQQNPTTTYPSAGTYTVTLIASDPSGCSDTITQQITINPNPVAGFTFSGTGTCQNSPVTFTNTSTGGTIYNWNFGNGQTSTQQNPTITYNQPGNYNVSLVVTSPNGCTDTLIQTIIIYPPPVANAGPDVHVCLGKNVTLQATGGTSYLWSNGATTGSISVSPTVTTTYTVTVTDGIGCTATDQVTVIVDPLPVATISPDQSICIGQSVTLYAGGGGTYYWNPTGDTTASITVSPTTSTTYAVNVTNGNGCTGSAFVNVIVHPLPVINLVNGFVCAGQTTTLNAGNPGSTYLWSPGGQTTQIITISNPGTYSVIVTNSYGCTASSASVISLGGTITNNMQNVSFCDGQSAVLNAGNPGNTYLWSPGGQTTQQITVNTSGSYSVIITDPNGCSGTIATTVNVFPLPQANFTPNDVCINQPINFVDISVVNGGTIVSWFWDFGDGTVSQQQNPTHNYGNNGSHTITLIVTSNNGCVDTITKTINVWPLPQANFSYSKDCEGEVVAFTDMSFTNFGNIVSWNWDFGDGSTSTLQNPSHQYLAPGTYTVTLTVTTAAGCTDTRPRILHIYPLPILSFTVSNTGVCLGNSISITNTSTTSNGAINNWLWNFGDGSTSNSFEPTHTYLNPGTFTITLIGTTSHGCSDTISQTVTIYALPTANAGSDQSICLGSSATLTASGGTSYVWSPGGATTASITVSPTVTTTYAVLVTDSNGCTGTDSVRVTIKSLPVANAGIDQSVCNGTSATLTATGGVSYLWTPGGATTASITVNPTATTLYIVTVTGANGCTATDTVKVTILPLPVANAGPDKTICNGLTTTLTASGGTTYLWSPSGATTATIYVNPTVNTSYSVLVTNANGCKNRDTVNVIVNPTPVVSLSPAFICTGNSVVLDAGNPGSTYLWTPNGETTQTITVSAAGTYEVIVTNSFGCQAAGSSIVTVGGTGIIGSLGNTAFCSGGSTTLNAGNAGSTYIWSTGATTQTINVNTSGTYTVTITDPTGCSSAFQAIVNVNPVPVAAFSVNPLCLGGVTNFTDLSTITSGNIISWSWNFGDGSVSASQNPSYQYTTAGTYSVTLQVTSGNGCTATATSSVVISPQPAVNFSNTTACFGTGTSFTDLSTIASGTISTWNWNFGDGSNSTIQNPVHIYSWPGTYTVTLIASSGNGCADTMTASVTVNPSPVADFASTAACKGTITDFTDHSSMLNGSITGYAWNFGDGNTSSLQNPSHLYATDGTFTATLIVTSDLGCTDTITHPVIVHPLPVAAITAPAVCLNNPTEFTDGSTVTSGTVNGWYWEFGDGTSSNNQNPIHTYNTDGTYTILLVATSNNGCVDSTTVNVTVYPLPQAGFANQDVCLNNLTTFTDSSSVSSGTITGWSWNFGDGGTSTQQNPSHNYAAYGTYQVSLIATSNFGCSDTISQAVNVFPLPVPMFSTAAVCYGTGTGFFNQTTISGGGNVTCYWNFGDGSTDTVLNPVHVFAAPGIYNVTMTATTMQGCTGTITLPVQVYDLPMAYFNGTDVCLNNPTMFNDASTAPPGGILVTWNWTFGDGGTSNSKNPIHTYTLPGIYNVTLTVTSNLGCSDLYSDSVQVFKAPLPVISANYGCITEPVTLINTEDSLNLSGSTFNWSFGDGTTSQAISPTHIYQIPGHYTITLEVINPAGCRATTTTDVDIYPAPDASFTANNGCAGTQVQFTNTSTISSGTIVGYQWYFGDSTTSALANPSHTFTTPGTYTVTLIAISDLGCTDTISQQITIYYLPVANFVNMNAAGCGPLPVAFTDSSFIQSGSITSWVWNFGDGEGDTIQNPVHIYQQSGAYTVSLTVTSDNGCTSTFTINNAVTVYPEPNAYFEPDPFTASILNPVINFNNLSTGTTIQSWSFGDGEHSDEFNPSHTYADTGTYEVILIVQNSFGCVDTFRQEVIIIPYTTFHIPNAFTPNSDGTNDVFTIKGVNIIDVRFTIFNRWGDPIFTTSNGFTHPWDGSIDKSNDVAKEDVYVYDATIRDIFGKNHQRIGRVTLVR